MGLFARVRRVNGAGLPAESVAPPALTLVSELDVAAAAELPARPAQAGAARAAAPTASPLRDGLQHLYAIRPSRDAFAEEAVKLIARGAGVKAAALLGYEPRGNRLRLWRTPVSSPRHSRRSAATPW